MILVVDNYLDPSGGTKNIVRFLGDRPWASTRPTREVLPSLEGWTAAILTGSGAMLSSGFEGEGMRSGWTGELVEWTRALVERGIPTLGVCFGHQVLGAAFGQGVRASARPEAGFLEIDVHEEGDPLMGALGQRFVSFVSHQDEVTGPQPDLIPLASTPDCRLHALRVRDRKAWGVQFHAEMALDEARGLLHMRAERHPELGIDIDAELARSHRAQGVGESLFGAFLAQVDAG